MIRDETGRINLALIWAVIVFLGVIFYWSTEWEIQISPTGLLFTGADVVRVAPKAAPIVQPIAFPHLTHMQKAGLPCDFCHTTVRTENFASLPSVDICMRCHSSKLTDNPEEEKIREYARNGEDIPWVQLSELPSHVYFPHES
ncbi:MAG: cytochrome c3 family protein, partial [Candidatus Hydrothermarchaeaceae archaeon]